MDGCDDFLLAWLEECEFDVRKGNVDSLSLDCTVSEAIQVAFQGTLGLFLTDTRSCVEIAQNGSFSLIDANLLLLDYILLGIFLTEFHSHLLL